MKLFQPRSIIRFCLMAMSLFTVTSYAWPNGDDTYPEPPAPSNPDILFPGQALNIGDAIISPDSSHELTLQSDGNLVLYNNTYNPPKAIWSTGTSSQGLNIDIFMMQGDGNAVLYGNGSKWTPVWSSGTSGNGGAYLRVQNDGNLVIYTYDTPYESSAHPIWSSGTAGQ